QKKGYSGVRVGTVDKFQGQEAPIVIYSLTSSNKDEIPAGRTEFLFLPNRTNVAVSRAQCLAVVVGSKDLIDTQPTTIPEMEALNNLCRIFQDVEGGEGISSEW
ncbi:MAG: C-terminal helicase domain-containing protein, partial [Acidimicrobiales bacterium]|nr:C-terminal helicase domain-containing protein [Acidimicrobiales bacterium]